MEARSLRAHSCPKGAGKQPGPALRLGRRRLPVPIVVRPSHGPGRRRGRRLAAPPGLWRRPYTEVGPVHRDGPSIQRYWRVYVNSALLAFVRVFAALAMVPSDLG